MIRQQGFTAVELLVTLFVATMFMAASYQLYSIIVKDSGDIRARSKASNIAYAELRKRADTRYLTCSNVDQPLPIPADHKLDNPEGRVVVICHLNGLTEVRTNIWYGPGTGTDRAEVKHAVFVAA